MSRTWGSLPAPLVEAEVFPALLGLPYLWESKGLWIVAVEALGDGSRSFGLSQTRTGKICGWMREPKGYAV